ncbi:MAG: glycosyltransferase family 2 protein [Clostridiales bacterium]|nr:glycosyltransferase family 2 protein [Clostridiales bacterium]
MISISLCMIVKDEEEVLARCLESVHDLVDEIVVVDTGSDDRTMEIAQRYTRHVLSFPWIDDFSAARNFAFAHGTKEYLMWLDADDLLLEKDRIAFIALKESLPSDTDVVMMKYHLAFDEAGEATFSNFRERLVRKDANLRWVGPVHEVIPPVGKVFYAHDVAVTHRKMKPSPPGRNLRIIEKYRAAGGKLDARQKFYYARELSDNGLYIQAAEAFEGYLNDGQGWVENQIEACLGLAACYLHLSRDEDGLDALVKSFRYDIPRAEVCCELGAYFLDRRRLHQAVFWYEQARGMKPVPERGGFVRLDCYGYLPCIQLCLCYHQQGMVEKAIEMNELAAGYRPDDRSVAYNRAFFAQLLGNSENRS